METPAMRKMLIGLVLVRAAMAGPAQPALNAAGHWQGKVQLPDREYNFTVDLARNPKGRWIGSLTFLNSNVNDIPLSDIVINGATVRFTVYIPEKSVFEGQLAADSSNMNGKVTSATGQPAFHITRYGDANVNLPPPSSPLPSKFEGAWEGALDGNGMAVILRLSRAADGTAKAVLYDVDQGRKQIPVTTVIFKGNVMQLEARSISGLYRGTLGAGGIVGEFRRGSNRFRLTFKRVVSSASKKSS